MMENNLIYIEEPYLAFGYNQRANDPRDGLTMFGAYLKDNVALRLGIIGTHDGVKRCKKYLQKISCQIKNIKEDIARPIYVGFETIFDFKINHDAIPCLYVYEEAISIFQKYQDPYQRVYNLVNLYVDQIINFDTDEDKKVDIWIVIIQDIIYSICRPNSTIPSSNENIKIGIKDKSHRNMDSLFEEDKQLQEAYKYENHFHNQLKARLLEKRIITQILRESTIAYSDFLNSKGSPKRDLSKMETDIAWNIATSLYYKAGGVPWKLWNIRKGVCYIGMVYKKTINDNNSRYACCAAQMFLDSGDGFVFKGNIGKWYNQKTEEFHISKESAKDLLDKALTTYFKQNNEYPKEIFIHSKSSFDSFEWAGFLQACENKSDIYGIRIRTEKVFKLYRENKYPVPRGIVFKVDEKSAFLWTKGFIPRLQTQIGLETPNPLKIDITRGKADIITVCSDILALTKLNYNSCKFADGLPVTLKFADKIGEILTAGTQSNIPPLPFRHYI